MILSYSRDSFVADIKAGRKIHTLREDPKKRWRPGMAIHHWRGNPRNVKSNPYEFLIGECKGVQEVEIIRCDFPFYSHGCRVWVDKRELRYDEISVLIISDGLQHDEFIKWFLPGDTRTWTGRIIHFTEYKY
jgi:hypothetical protein